MTVSAETQRQRAISLLRQQGMARASELLAAGVTAATVARMLAKAEIIQLSRGLYQLPDAPSDVNNALAQAVKRVPKGVICLTSALAFHELGQFADDAAVITSELVTNAVQHVCNNGGETIGVTLARARSPAAVTVVVSDSSPDGPITGNTAAGSDGKFFLACGSI